MSPFNDYAGVVGMLMGLVAVAPKIIAVITRKRQVDASAEINRFEAIMKAQDARLNDCEAECKECEDARRKEQAEWAREREYFFRQLAHLNSRVFECEGVLRRINWVEQRKVSRIQRTAG